MRIASFVLLGLIAATAVRADTSPYAGEQERTIKALSSKEIDDLSQGRGMGLAKAAELNGFPGPAHVLDLADRLGLDASQRAATEAIAARMKAEAQRIGTELIAAEQALDRAFAARSIDDGALQAKLTEIAALQGELRYVHLRAHLAQAALLTPAQIAHYDRLRGYAPTEPAPAPARDGHGAHRH